MYNVWRYLALKKMSSMALGCCTRLCWGYQWWAAVLHCISALVESLSLYKEYDSVNIGVD